MPKSKRGKERPRYCRCTVTCTSKIKRTTRLRHYRKANIPFDEAPPSITATESSAEDGPESTIHIECNQSRRDESMHDGILESNSKRGLDDGDSEELGYFGGNQLENQQESEYEALRMDVDEDSADTASGLEEEDFNNNEASEFDAWKEFDEQAEEDFLSDSDRLSELDKMLEDDLAADADEAEGWANRKEFLTEADHDNIRAFKVRMVANMPRVAFNQMRYAFKHKLDINSHYSIIRRLAVLSGIEPSYFDCCPNSCIAYTGEYADLDQCPLCSQVRFREGTNRVPRRQFGYIPLIHRLQNFFANPKAVEELSYRDKYQAKAGVISDVFDGEHYQSLILRAVTVDGKKLEHKYFSGRHDIAFSVCLDGYLLYKRRRGGPSATPIIVQIYNLPPEIRTLISRTLCLGVIPGPKGPKRIDTFLHAFETECVELAIGVNTFNCVTQSHFPLHAYNLFPHGDILAIEKFLNVKGHNGKCPCRSCKIKAINNPDSRDKTYYTPLSHPRKQPKRKCFSLDPLDLPLRAHEDWTDATAQLASAVKVMDRKALAKELGIKGMPALTRVGSINYARGIPWDFMHLLFENVIKNLVYLWMGKFKGLDEGNENYTIPPAIWEEIGKETVEAVKHIPSAFVRSLGNLAEDSSYFTAEGWAFWYMFLAPILLQGRFQKTVYYTHLCELADIMKTCIKFSLRHEEIDELEVRIADWVKDYERIYYQYNINRLSTCTLTIHGLLHVCDNIRFCGPVWTTWTFWMERYCGYLQAGLRSRSHPWANLTNRVLHKAYLDQIDIYYDLEDDVTITSKGLRRGEKVFNGYPHSILRPPYKKSFTLDAELQSKISRYFSAVINNRKSAAIRKKLPKTMSSWGKVRIAGGGDCIRAVSGKNSNRGRNMSYVRYEVEVIDADNNNIREIFYGRLDLILEFDIPHSDFWTPDFCGTTVLLAVITPCVTSGKDATKEVTTYTQTTTQIVTDLRTISAVIGRIWTQNRWGIVDRSEDTSRTEFIPSNMEVFDLPGSDDIKASQLTHINKSAIVQVRQQTLLEIVFWWPLRYSNSSKVSGPSKGLVGLNLNKAQVWKGRKVVLSRTLELYKGRREAVQVGIEHAGGVVLRFDGDRDEPEPKQGGEKLSKKERIRRRDEAHRVADCDVLVTRWRHGRVYVSACQGGKTVGTLAWLFHVQSLGVLSNPQDQLLHHVPKRNVEAFSKHVITVTNYTGETCEYIKKLIAAMGATFTPSMSGENTALIAAYLGGTKADKAQSWSIPIVNHTWLEDCFIQWRNLMMALEKYIVFPPGIDFSSLLGERGVGVGNQVMDETGGQCERGRSRSGRCGRD